MAVTIAEITAAVKHAFDKELLRVYPVGAVYISTSSTSPATLFGGTWEALPTGRCLIGAGTGYSAGATGGATTHTITTDQMPSHSHGGTTGSAGGHSHSGRTESAGNHYHGSGWGERGTGPHGNYANGYNRTGSGDTDGDNNEFATSTDGAHTHGISIDSVGGHVHSINAQGGGQPINIMQPYLVVYMWKRTA